jgi:hypothetical protein
VLRRGRQNRWKAIQTCAIPLNCCGLTQFQGEVRKGGGESKWRMALFFWFILESNSS